MSPKDLQRRCAAEYIASLPEPVRERVGWANGAVMCDPLVRMDSRRQSIHLELAELGGRNVAFWRGILENSGSIGMTGGGASHPIVNAKGSPRFLWGLVDFLYRQDLLFDHENLLARQCSAGALLLHGMKAVAIVESLWPRGRDSFGYAQNNRKAETIVGWVPRHGDLARRRRVERYVDFELIDGLRRPQSRPDYQHLLPAPAGQ